MTEAEKNERLILLRLQSSPDRPMMQYEFARLQALNALVWDDIKANHVCNDECNQNKNYHSYHKS